MSLFKYILFFLTVHFLFPEIQETVNLDKVKVGDEVIYSLEETASKLDCVLPKIDFLLLDNNPYAEIVESKQEDKKIIVKIIFYKSGKFKIPIECKNFKSEKEITVETVLENEKEALDIAEPILFSGNYTSRLIMMLIFGGLFFIGIAYLLWKWKAKSKLKPFNADYVGEMKQPIDVTYKSQLLRFINQTEIPHKEFIFLLSSYIKEKIELKLKYPVQHFTQKEINELLLNKFNISNIDVLSIDSYFNSVKYMPNEENISQTKAFGLVEYWDRLIR